MIEVSLAERAPVDYEPISACDGPAAKPDVPPTWREGSGLRVAGNERGRSAYFFAIVWHTSPVFTICERCPGHFPLVIG